MYKLNFTKQEIENIKQKVYFTEDELLILDMWLHEKSIVEMALKLNLSPTTISRRKKSILNKISKVM